MAPRSRGHSNTLSSGWGTDPEITASSCPVSFPLPTLPSPQPGQVVVPWSFLHAPLSPYRGGAAWHGRYCVSSNELAAWGRSLRVWLPRGLWKVHIVLGLTSLWDAWCEDLWLLARPYPLLGRVFSWWDWPMTLACVALRAPPLLKQFPGSFVFLLGSVPLGLWPPDVLSVYVPSRVHTGLSWLYSMVDCL